MWLSFIKRIVLALKGEDMSKSYVLITGARGEIGHSLIEYISEKTDKGIIALDIRDCSDLAPSKSTSKEFVSVVGDIRDRTAIANVFDKYNIDTVFHLAAILSSGGEREPEKTHGVNVEGSFNLITAAKAQGQKRGKAVKFIFPSTIAAYGIPTLDEKNSSGKINEDQFLSPITMYGCNKLYVENLGRYYSETYRLLDSNPADVKLDFRAIRFVGLMSSETMPTGGTSDYGSEMIHFAAQNKPYACFVRPDARLPFMSMPDAIRALIELSNAPKEKLTRRTYNVGAFSVSAKEIQEELLKAFPGAEISYSINEPRQRIVDSWPGDVDDSRARADWGWNHTMGFEEAFRNYLIPNITKRYR